MSHFNAAQKKNFWALLVIALVFFALFAVPNAAASKNLAMVEVFSADEAQPLPYVFHMIEPGQSLVQTLKNFVFYNYYPYGFVHFAWSALVLLPLQWLGLLDNTTLVMLVLRQMVSVLPMLAALLILVYLQDEFRTYRSILLFIFLVSIPAVVQNNLWWHPDGLVTLWMALALASLYRDDLHFGRGFYLSAVFCGLAIATKMTGLYFFLAVGLVLLLGWRQKKLSLGGVAKKGTLFILAMAATYFVASPFWLSHWARTDFLTTMRAQTAAITRGYGTVYAMGPLATWPQAQAYYGALAILLSLAVAIWAALRRPNRLLYGLILAWLIPLTVMVFFISHFKFQYWMPAVLPTLSCIVLVLPEHWAFKGKKSLADWLRAGAMGIVVLQFALFLVSDIPNVVSAIHREEGNASIAFYGDAMQVLDPVKSLPLNVYYDPSVYLPQTGDWSSTTTFDLLTYDYIAGNHFDVLLIMQGRIRDYLNPNATGIDPNEFALSQKFYRDAQTANIRGYRLVYENDFGKAFVSDDLYLKMLP